MESACQNESRRRELGFSLTPSQERFWVSVMNYCRGAGSSPRLPNESSPAGASLPPAPSMGHRDPMEAARMFPLCQGTVGKLFGERIIYIYILLNASRSMPTSRKNYPKSCAEGHRGGRRDKQERVGNFQGIV